MQLKIKSIRNIKKMNLYKRIIYSLKELLNWLPLASFIALSLIFIGMISIYFDYILSMLLHSIVIKLITASALLFITLILINRQRKKFNKISIPLERNLEGKYFNTLILPISYNNNIADVIINKEVNNFTVKCNDMDIVVNSNELEEILIKSPNENSKKFRNWQMPLISIYKNMKLEKETKGVDQVWLIGSGDKADKKSSVKQLKLFSKILFFFSKGQFDIYVYDKKNKKGIKIDRGELDNCFSAENIMNIAVDFEKFEDVYETFNEIINKIQEIGKKEGKKIKEHEIAIDITGGQKPISIAGALATLNRKTRIIYVNTNNKPEIKEIDAIMQSEQGQ